MTDIKSNLTNCCKKLRLSASLAERAMVQEGSSNQEYLLNLLTEEIANRDAARLTRNLNSAGFPCRYTPEQYRTDEIDFGIHRNNTGQMKLTSRTESALKACWGWISTTKAGMSSCTEVQELVRPCSPS